MKDLHQRHVERLVLGLIVTALVACGAAVVSQAILWGASFEPRTIAIWAGLGVGALAIAYAVGYATDPKVRDDA